MILSILFYMFAAGLLSAAALTVFGRNLVTSVLFLVVSFFNAAGLFLLLNAEFLAFSLIIVYVGAIAVIFLFVVMMLDIKKTPLKEHLTKFKPAMIMMSLLLMGQTGLLATFFGRNINACDTTAHTLPAMTNVSNTHLIGGILYTNHVLPFQLSGIVLLIAMVGAIVLCHEKRNIMRRQSVRDQVIKKQTTYLTSPEIGEGVNY
jgi:NADH-quinone oxidoreductase subunit J